MTQTLYDTILADINKFYILEREFQVEAKEGKALVKDVSALILIRKALSERLRAYANKIDDEIAQSEGENVRVLLDLLDESSIKK